MLNLKKRDLKDNVFNKIIVLLFESSCVVCTLWTAKSKVFVTVIRGGFKILIFVVFNTGG